MCVTVYMPRKELSGPHLFVMDYAAGADVFGEDWLLNIICMKKILLLFAVAAMFAGCGNPGDLAGTVWKSLDVQVIGQDVYEASTTLDFMTPTEFRVLIEVKENDTVVARDSDQGQYRVSGRKVILKMGESESTINIADSLLMTDPDEDGTVMRYKRQ